MLVLTRWSDKHPRGAVGGDSIVLKIAEYYIEIKLVSIDGTDRIKLGVDAPEHVLIARKELMSSENFQWPKQTKARK